MSFARVSSSDFVILRTYAARSRSETLNNTEIVLSVVSDLNILTVGSKSVTPGPAGYIETLYFVSVPDPSTAAALHSR
jgi:hypothetical protein